MISAFAALISVIASDTQPPSPNDAQRLYDRFYPWFDWYFAHAGDARIAPTGLAGLALCGLVGNSILNSVSMTHFLAGTSTFDVASGYPLSVIPLFVLMGEIASSSRMSRELFQAARVALSGLRAGLLCVHCRFRRIWSYQWLLGSDRRKHDTNSAAKCSMQDTRKDMPLLQSPQVVLRDLDSPSIILVIYGSIAEASVARLFAFACTWHRIATAPSCSCLDPRQGSCQR